VPDQYPIDANQETVTAVDIAGLDDVKKHIGYDSVDSDEIDATGDRPFFDESCFLRDQTGKGRFKLGMLVDSPFRGRQWSSIWMRVKFNSRSRWNASLRSD
jgi:hypothetical protein